MAAHIDLNPMRASHCGNPKDYRWCGDPEAAACGRGGDGAGWWTVSAGFVE